MKFSIAATALYFAGLVLAQTPGFTINTPNNPVQCQPLLISWSGGTGPYFLSVHNGDDPSGPALADLGQQPAGATSFSWPRVTFQANTRIGFSLRDSTGATAQTAAVTVQPNSDNSCLAGGSSSPSSGTPSSTGGTPAPTTSSSGSTPAVTTPTPTPTVPSTSEPVSNTSRPTSSSSAASRAVTSQGSNTTSSRNAAPTNAAHVGAAGLVGAAIMAILA